MRAGIVFLLVGLVLMPLAPGAGAGNVSVTPLLSFNGTNGANPQAALVLGADNYFYGTTSSGGSNWPGSTYGTVFKLAANGTMAWSASFNQTNGSQISSALTPNTTSNFFGTAYSGGTTNGQGTIFKITTNGTLTAVYSFIGGNVSGQNDAGHPYAALVRASDGNFYGSAVGNGFSASSIYRFSASGTLSNLYFFNSCSDGAQPEVAMVQGADGILYGTATHGGVSCYPQGYGTAFKVTTNGAFTPLVSFSLTNGAYFPSSLAQGADGNFYGTTDYGGTTNLTALGYGTVFRLTTNGVLTTMHAFTNGIDGAYPFTALTAGVGKFYGTTSGGGASNSGTIFLITTNGVMTTLYSFPGGTNGASCYGALTWDNSANLYGTTRSGGTYGVGTAFVLSFPPPTIQNVTVSNHVVSLIWNSVVGETYQLQYQTNLNQPSWLNLGSLITATNGAMTASDAPGSGAGRFYRMLLVP